jgi:short-subunit dehydrogenase involved in D-alanine esterification of teichoic acids
VEFKELEPPAVKTDLVPGQRDSEWAMPLEEFVSEVIDILEKTPDATEIQVENVKFLRYSEARGEYAHAVAVLNSADPHGN